MSSARKGAKEGIFSFPFILSIGLFLTSFVPVRAWAQEKEDLRVRTVVIDPGHGGKDPGAIGHSQVQEKEIVLDIALKLGERIKERYENVEVIYTRKTDKFVELHERGRIANENDADLFISLHANVAGNSNVKGCETFVLGLHRSNANLEVAKKENSAILMEEDHERHYGDFDPHSPESYIALELMQSEFLEQSLNFAAKAQKEFRTDVERKDRGVKQAGFLVLYRTTMPSILTELGFISNPDEEAYLNSEQGQNEMANGLLGAFKAYKKRIDDRNSFRGTKDSILASQPKSSEETTETDGGTVENGEGAKVRFKVQLVASSDAIELRPENFNGLSNVDEYISEDGVHKYTLGNTSSYKEAERIKQEAKGSGYEGAFIIAFQDGERIGLQKAMDLAKRNGEQ